MQNENTKFSLNYMKMPLINLEELAQQYNNHIEEDIINNYQPFSIANLQTFNPIYSEFFEMNENNHSKISLNHTNIIINLNTIENITTGERQKKDIYIKFSPLLDPLRYMIGKYEIENDKIRTLPSFLSNESVCIPKLLTYNNASYTDCFFTFLTSKLSNHNNFIHGLDFYGTYLGIQSKFRMNITDDLDYLKDSKFFIENNNKYYNIANFKFDEIKRNNSRRNKIKLKIEDMDFSVSTDYSIQFEITELPSNITETTNEVNENNDLLLDCIYDLTDSQNYQSFKSMTDDDDDDDDDDDEDHDDDDDDGAVDGAVDDNNEEEDGDDWSEFNEDDEDNVIAYIHNFPIQMICMEKCDGTFDELFENELINEDNGASYLMQIIMILITYQKIFKFTHNDLHTNNIMYVNTDIEYLYYKYNSKTYKVPTYGKIIKLIDFGRSIYTFQNILFCSDSFDTGGDANSQYNFQPYYNPKKPLLYPNYSFDLCRLGCSIFDFILDIDNLIDVKKMNQLQKIIYEWCNDDNNKNVLYKKNGEERYKNFNLYKMIAKTVNRHIPSKQLTNPYFKQFLLKKSDVSINSSNYCILDIDSLPIYS